MFKTLQIMAQEEKVRCPQCEWEPDGGAYWQCHCGHVWDTFETYGQCPNCKTVHRHTQCPMCHRWSPHADWCIDLPPIHFEEMENSQSNPKKTVS
jgi:RNA polymerase subunit RPABC4/transcription elongation factor Spt4